MILGAGPEAETITTSKRPALDQPMILIRSSRSECSKSLDHAASGLFTIDFASVNAMPCRRRFASDLSGSQSYVDTAGR